MLHTLGMVPHLRSDSEDSTDSSGDEGRFAPAFQPKRQMTDHEVRASSSSSAIRQLGDRGKAKDEVNLGIPGGEEGDKLLAQYSSQAKELAELGVEDTVSPS